MKDFIFICVVKENNRTTFFCYFTFHIFKATYITSFFFCELIFFLRGQWVVYVNGVLRRAINLKICREASDLHSVVRGN